ncbi:MAG TPA: DMT family transporter [Candidatus Stackebrandtia faecavium]|nr:DMT family transporter [Candidatus Stackebrandtia faecavium]
MTSAWLGVVIALVGAFAYALGASVQHLDAVELGATPKLMRRRRWWIGGAISFTGAGLHALALAMAPLTVIQPISMTTLVYAVPLAAKLYGRKPGRRELMGALAVAIGLAGLMLLMPVQNSTPHLGEPVAVTFLVGVLAFVAVTLLVGRKMPGRWRAFVYAMGAGISTGTVSTFVRLVGAGLDEDFAGILHWFTLVVPVMLVVATVMLQTAYAVGYFGIAYTASQIFDPVISVLAGASLLGEPLPTDPRLAVPAALCGLLLAAGTVVLGRHTPYASGEKTVLQVSDTLGEALDGDMPSQRERSEPVVAGTSRRNG